MSDTEDDSEGVSQLLAPVSQKKSQVSSQKPATRKSSYKVNDSQVSSSGRTGNRQGTPLSNKQSLYNGDDSRDELAKTASAHDGRRRKRDIAEYTEGEDDSPVQSPVKTARRSYTQPMQNTSSLSQSKAASQSVRPSSSKAALPKTSAKAALPKASALKPKSTNGSSTTVKPIESQKASATNTQARKPSTGNALSGEPDEDSRSRSNSTATLLPGSNEHSQRQNDSGQNSIESPGVAISKKARKKTTFEKTEAAALSELNILSRRYFLTYLSNSFVDEPIQTMFSGMRRDSAMYKEARGKVQKGYKTWKAQILAAAGQFVQRWMSTMRRSRVEEIAKLGSFSELRAEIRQDFDNSWLETVFKFGVEAVNFEDIAKNGIRYLKYAFLQLTTHQRMTELHEADPHDPTYIKYTRSHLLDMFDALHDRREFVHNIDHFPERIIPRSIQHKRRPKLDINQDSDGSLSESDDAGDNEGLSDGNEPGRDGDAGDDGDDGDDE